MKILGWEIKATRISKSRVHSKRLRNGKLWTKSEERTVNRLLAEDKSHREIAIELQRSDTSIRQRIVLINKGNANAANKMAELSK